jgi:hypothetical protein
MSVSRRAGLAFGLVALAGAFLLELLNPAHAVDTHDFTLPSEGTKAVYLAGGDTPATYSVSCTNNAAAVVLRAAVSNRSRRKICFQNTGNTTVKIGSSTVSASDLFVLGESTNSATSPLYCTNNSGQFYCTAGLTTTQTVIVLEETQSIP